VSESTKKELLESGIPDININVVHNGVDHEVYKPSPHTKSPYPLVTYVGRIRRYKNIDQ